MRVDTLNESSIDLIRPTTDWGGWLKLKEGLLYAIKKIVEEAGAGFALERVPNTGPTPR